MDKAVELAANQELQGLAQCQREVKGLRSELEMSTAILNTVDAIALVLDPKGHIVRCNSSFGQMTGYPLNGVKNQLFWDLCNQNERESVKAVFKKIQQDKTALAHEHNWITKDGICHCIAWDYTPCLNSDGAVKYVIGIGKDITSKTQVELATQQRVAQLEEQNRLCAIQRDRDRRAREEAELMVLLEREKAASVRAAELAKANATLRRSLSWLAHEGDLNRFLKQVLLEITATVQADLAHLFVLHEPDRMLTLIARTIDGELSERSTPTEPVIFSTPFSADITPAFRLMEEQNLLLTLDMVTLQPDLRETMWPDAIEWHLREGRKQVVALVLKAGDRSVGFLGLGFREQRQFSQEEQELVIALANQVALALELTRLAEEAKLAAIARAEEAKLAAILEERNRIAREIHDTLAQGFTGVIIQLEATKRKISSAQLEAAQTHITRARSLAAEGLAEARRSVQALRPETLESRNLPDALCHLAEQMTCAPATQIIVQIEGSPYALPVEIETNLLRIAQEALTNALRHAQAQTIRLELGFETAAVHLHITDDGQGFDPESQLMNTGFGLIGMQERSQRLGGQFTLTSIVGQGTEIAVSIPI